MSDISISMSIPLDEDGFIELRCAYCQNRFMLHQDVFLEVSNLHFFCPICGLPNDTDKFYCPEVLEAAQQKVTNYLNSEILRQINSSIKKLNKSSFIKMTLKAPKQEPEKELYTPVNGYVLFHHPCCGVDVKALEFDVQIGLYCPICGGSEL